METIPEYRERSLSSFGSISVSESQPCHAMPCLRDGAKALRHTTLVYLSSFGLSVCDIISVSPLHLSQCEKQVLILRLPVQLRLCVH